MVIGQPCPASTCDLHVGARRAGDMRALARLGPRRGMNPLLDRRFHQRVIGRVKAHQVDPPPIAVVGVEFRRIPVGERAELEVFGRSRARPEGLEPARRPTRALAPDRLLKRRVRVEEIVVRNSTGWLNTSCVTAP